MRKKSRRGGDASELPGWQTEWIWFIRDLLENPNWKPATEIEVDEIVKAFAERHRLAEKAIRVLNSMEKT